MIWTDEYASIHVQYISDKAQDLECGEQPDVPIEDILNPRLGADKREHKHVDGLKDVQMDPNDPFKNVKLDKNISKELREELIRFLKKSMDVLNKPMRTWWEFSPQ